MAHELSTFIETEFQFSDTDLYNELRTILYKVDSYWYSGELIPDVKNEKDKYSYKIINIQGLSGRLAMLQIIAFSIHKYVASLIYVKKIWPKIRKKPIKK